MFCPQCRSSWSRGAAGKSNIIKSKRDRLQSTQWGTALLCPNCHVPLAADRIQGEFPSVAHASSAKERSVTIKDVLRESSAGGVDTGEIPLDDKKNPAAFRLFESDSNGKRIFKPRLAMQLPVQMRLGGIAIAALMLTLVSVGVRSHISVRHGHSVKPVIAASTAKGNEPSSKHTLTALQQDMLSLMPQTVGNWTRTEANSEIWRGINAGDDAEQTFVSTYKLGTKHIELWASRAIEHGSSTLFSATASAKIPVHTDNGVVSISPKINKDGRVRTVAFDYTPHSESDWIEPTAPLFSGLPHSISWNKSSYLVTVAATNKDDRDSFVKALSGDEHQL